MPALAVADALATRGAEVSFIGLSRGSGAGLVESAGFPEKTLPLRGLVRRVSLRNVATIGLALLALPRAARELRRRKADVVIGAGGYVGGPVALAAWLTRRPVVLTEADSHLGLANRIMAPLAKRVALAFPLRGRRGRKWEVVGRPVSQAVREATRTAGRVAFGIPDGEHAVLIMGGSQGARRLNQAALSAFSSDPPMHIIHVAGPGQYEETDRVLGDAGPRYRLFPYLDNLPLAIAACDLVISRSGGSVFEIAAIGRPSVLVPYPHATADHQTTNARWLAEAGAAIILTDEVCTGERLREIVGALLADEPRLESMAAAAKANGRPDAADRIAEIALELVD